MKYFVPNQVFHIQVEDSYFTNDSNSIIFSIESEPKDTISKIAETLRDSIRIIRRARMDSQRKYGALFK